MEAIDQPYSNQRRVAGGSAAGAGHRAAPSRRARPSRHRGREGAGRAASGSVSGDRQFIAAFSTLRFAFLGAVTIMENVPVFPNPFLHGQIDQMIPLSSRSGRGSRSPGKALTVRLLRCRRDRRGAVFSDRRRRPGRHGPVGPVCPALAASVPLRASNKNRSQTVWSSSG